MQTVFVNQRFNTMKFVYNDGGRKKAGYKGNAGDCVTRAISIATGFKYQVIYDCIFSLAGKTPRNGVLKKKYHNYIQELGFKWVPIMKIGTGCKMHLNADEFPKTGTYIVRLSKHLTTVINGEILDTYDPSRNGERCVYGYYEKL